jgi:hypothetical protein
MQVFVEDHHKTPFGDAPVQEQAIDHDPVVFQIDGKGKVIHV